MPTVEEVCAVRNISDELIKKYSNTDRGIFVMGCIDACVRRTRSFDSKMTVVSAIQILIDTLECMKASEQCLSKS